MCVYMMCLFTTQTYAATKHALFNQQTKTKKKQKQKNTEKPFSNMCHLFSFCCCCL